MGISSALGSSALLPAGLGFRNKIINGDMRINQRNATITGAGTIQHCTDRWGVYNNAGTVTFQQSTVAPAGYTNSLLATVTATGSYSTSAYTLVTQFIEGSNVADLAWGTSSAKPIVISFWVRSSVTGTYTVCLQNAAQSRSYVAPYTINAANTWEQKFITVQGETTGTWLTQNDVGLRVWFGLGLGTQWDTTANAWQSLNFYSVSGSVDFAANSGATFYLTGVQVEQNLQPTPFEQRPFGIELNLCQRYFQRMIDPVGTGCSNGTPARILIPLYQQMRVQPTGSSSGTFNFYNGAAIATTSSIQAWYNSLSHGQLDFSVSIGSAGNAIVLYSNGGSQYLDFNSEL
jgi:hypothetical protein